MAMSMPLSAARAHVGALIAALALSALAWGPAGGLDGITVTKATAVVVVALLALAIAAWAAVRHGQITLPTDTASLAAGVFGLLLVLRALFADDGLRAVLGAFGRWNGVALYLACLVLFLVAAQRGRDAAPAVVRGLLLTGIVVALGAIDEAFLGLGPQWGDRPGAASTLGNANFLAAWSACVFALATATVVDATQPRVWRIVGGVALPLLLVAMILSQSFQAGYVAAAGLAVVALAWLSVRASRPAFLVAAATAGVAGVTGAALTVLGAMQRGPASFLGDSIGVRLRAEYWAAAGRMISEHPLAGVGPGRYADHYRMFRSEQAATLVALQSNTDSAHNVPLHMFAEWGLLVGLAWIVFAGVVTWAMARRLQSLEGAARLGYAGMAAVWVGYLLQSLISIDTPVMVTLGWISAGLVVAPLESAPAGTRTVALPWGRVRPNQALPLGARLSDYGIAAVLLVALWAAVTPWTADVGSRGGEIEIDRSGPVFANTGATAQAPWETRYWLQLTSALGEAGQMELMMKTMEHTLELAPERFEVVVNAARVADAAERTEESLELYERALELEPNHPDLAVEVARVVHGDGDDERARGLVERALAVDPEHDEARELHEQW
jgi:O-antigen ligase